MLIKTWLWVRTLSPLVNFPTLTGASIALPVVFFMQCLLQCAHCRHIVKYFRAVLYFGLPNIKFDNKVKTSKLNFQSTEDVSECLWIVSSAHQEPYHSNGHRGPIQRRSITPNSTQVNAFCQWPLCVAKMPSFQRLWHLVRIGSKIPFASVVNPGLKCFFYFSFAIVVYHKLLWYTILNIITIVNVITHFSTRARNRHQAVGLTVLTWRAQGCRQHAPPGEGDLNYRDVNFRGDDENLHRLCMCHIGGRRDSLSKWTVNLRTFNIHEERNSGTYYESMLKRQQMLLR